MEYARFDNMRRLEEELQVSASGRRLVPGKRGKSDSYKVRRAKVGGWRDYFDEEQVAALDARVQSGLRPGFGYGPSDDRLVGGDPESGDQTNERRVSA